MAEASVLMAKAMKALRVKEPADELTSDQASEYLGFGKRYLATKRYRYRVNSGPAFTRKQDGTIRYKIKDLDEWKAAHGGEPANG